MFLDWGAVGAWVFLRRRDWGIRGSGAEGGWDVEGLDGNTRELEDFYFCLPFSVLIRVVRYPSN